MVRVRQQSGQCVVAVASGAQQGMLMRRGRDPPQPLLCQLAKRGVRLPCAFVQSTHLGTHALLGDRWDVQVGIRRGVQEVSEGFDDCMQATCMEGVNGIFFVLLLFDCC